MTDIATAAQHFIDRHVEEIQPLLREVGLASWEAATTGSEAAIQRSAELRTRFKQVYARPDEFEQVRRFRTAPELTDPLLARQLKLLDHAYTANQLPPATIEELTHRESELERIFYNFRPTFEDRTYSDNELRELLCAESDSGRRQRIWEASKAIGPQIGPPLLELVRRRNEAARELGFKNYYSMELELQEIEESSLFQLLEEFQLRSEHPFQTVREELDRELAARFSLDPEALRPWHWEDFFSQQAPESGPVDLDPLFAPLSQEDVVRDYFADLDLPVEPILIRSDLYEREGKDQHAFCTDIDRNGDVRILCNLRPNERWMATLLHELGHGVYDLYLPRSLPFLLRTPAHTLTTEAIAMYFGRLTRDPEWLRNRIGSTMTGEEESEIHRQQRLSMLIAARWMLVMVHFERALYSDPDRPDLNRLWWDLVEKFQLIRRPDGRDEPDWATKIHLALAPVYYHNYLLGELMASQLTRAIAESGDTPGEFLRNRIFAPGASLPWSELIEQATGEPLAPLHFVEQFVQEPFLNP